MESWLLHIAANHAYLVYVVIGIAGIIEGPILAVLMGIMVRAGYFGFLPIYITLMLADLVGDIGMYYLGYHYGRRFVIRFGKRFSVTEESVQKMETLYHKHKHKILFISKLTGGLGLPVVTLVTAGIVKIPFYRYMTVNFFGQVIWSAMLLCLGYFFGGLYSTISSVLGKSFLVGIVVVLVFVLYRYSKKIRKTIVV